jgi:hypothetical protein
LKKSIFRTEILRILAALRLCVKAQAFFSAVTDRTEKLRGSEMIVSTSRNGGRRGDFSRILAGRLKPSLRFLDLLALFLLSSFFISCSPSQPAQQPQTITAYSTSSAQPWMNDLVECANESSVLVNVTADEPDIFIRIGEPDELYSPAYQIGAEEIFIAVNRESAVKNLSLEEAQASFAGLGAESFQAWVYPSELDLFGVFDQVVMQGRSVAPGTKVAASPGAMSDAINADPAAVGILPARWLTGNHRKVFSLGVFPVLAIVEDGAARSVLACLQAN